MQHLQNWGWYSMGKRHEAALKVKPVLQKGAQSLEDTESLKVKGVYFAWDDLKKPEHECHSVKEGFKFSHDRQLYKTRQPDFTFTDVYVPGAEGTESLFSVIDETHAGTIDEPIPYNGNMALEEGKYYSQNGVIYLCVRDTVNPVYHELADLVGSYVELVGE